MKRIVIYHRKSEKFECPDGTAAAAVVSLCYPDAVLYGGMYGQEPPDVSAYRKIVIVDFSYPGSILRKWRETSKVMIIDHHKTALNDLSGLSSKVMKRIDLEESGATLTWKTLFPNRPMPKVLEYVRDQDLWLFNLPQSREVNAGISSLKKGRIGIEVVKELMLLNDSKLLTATVDLGVKKIEETQKRVEAIANEEREVGFQWQGATLRVGVLEIPEEDLDINSGICSLIYRKKPEYQFVLGYTSIEGGWAISLRSNREGSNFDVSMVAKANGGGGHLNASGCVMSTERLQEYGVF